ncbi:MAG: MBL fold metallo-hydrolase [Pseudomonadota bacterium]
MIHAIIRQLALGQMMNFTYLVGREGGAACAVVDPGWEVGAIANAAKAEGWKIGKILLTHSHFDHAGAVAELARSTGAGIYVHASEVGEIPKGLEAHPTEEGAAIDVEGLNVKCMHTPGHTPGSQCFIVDGSIITGDTLFVDGCGRVDLPGSDPRKMLESLARLAKLPPATVIYPGHDYGPAPTSTIGEQLKSNPYLSARSEGMLL